MNRTPSSSQREDQRSKGGRVKLALLLVLLSGCETYFVDPFPPELVSLPREQALKPYDTPLVYGLLFDIHLPDTAECTRVKQQLTTALRAALLPAGREGMELPAQDLSPECVQRGDQRFFYDHYVEMSREVVKRYGEGRARPVFFYFNNVALPMSASLREDFHQLQTRTPNSPQVWALTTSEAQQDVHFAQTASWTYSADPRLTASLETLARAQLPFIRLEQPPAEGFALFTPEELAWARAFKGCMRPSSLSGLNFTYGSQATPVDAAHPPRFQVGLPAQPLVPRSEKLSPATFRFRLEVCRDHCERFFSLPPNGEPTAWDTTPRCFLTGSP